MDNELRHFGILGMKWGVRRYQNADGTLTQKGKEHYGKIRDKIADKQKAEEEHWNKKARYVNNLVDSISKSSEEEYAKECGIEWADPKDIHDSYMADLNSERRRARQYELYANISKTIYGELYSRPLGSLKNKKEYEELANSIKNQMKNEFMEKEKPNERYWFH